MEEQKERARGKSFHVVGDDGDDGAFVELRPVESTEFIGYDDLTCDAEIGLFRRVDDDAAVVRSTRRRLPMLQLLPFLVEGDSRQGLKADCF